MKRVIKLNLNPERSVQSTPNIWITKSNLFLIIYLPLFAFWMKLKIMKQNRFNRILLLLLLILLTAISIGLIVLSFKLTTKTTQGKRGKWFWKKFYCFILKYFFFAKQKMTFEYMTSIKQFYSKPINWMSRRLFWVGKLCD